MAILEHATRRVFSRRTRGRSFVPPSVSSLSLSHFSFLHHLLHPVPSSLGCLFGTGTGRWVLHFALALLLQVPGPLRTRARAREQERKREREHGAVCYNARPLLALLPVLLLLSLLLPVAAEWRMGKQRADEPAATSSAALEANYTPPARLASS